jgi:hypothetical protein
MLCSAQNLGLVEAFPLRGVPSKVVACFQRKPVATSGMSPSVFDYIRVPCYSSVFRRLGTFSHLTLRTRKPRSRFRLLGNVLSSKSLILQSLLVGGYNLLSSADSDTNFGRRRRGRQYWDSLSVIACCSFLANLNLFTCFPIQLGIRRPFLRHFSSQISLFSWISS